MKEDPSHWALKASFGKTVGTGWREPWRDAVKSVARFAAPTGMTFDAYGDDKFKVQISGSLLDGQRTLTITLGGEW